jgi:heavy metal sensor kinase
MYLKLSGLRSVFKNREAITFRLTLRYSLLIAITLVLVSASTLLAVRLYLYSVAETQLLNISDTIGQKLQSNATLTENELQEIANVNQNVDISIQNGNENVFETSEHYNIKAEEHLVGQVEALELDEENLIYYSAEFQSPDDNSYTVQIIKDMSNERDFIKALFIILLVINGIAFGGSIILGYLMSIRALSPINKIINQAQKITVSDLSQRIELIGPDDELKRLSYTFNQMITRIEAGYEKQNQFALDASHELATPLSVIKGYLDILARWGRNDPKIMDEALYNMQKEIDNITSLLDTLLFIAKGDNDISKIEKQDWWLNELMTEIYKDAQLIYSDHHFKLEMNQSIFVSIDVKLVRQMIRALIDNGVKYSLEGSTITLSLLQSHSFAKIIIADQGIGIDEQDLNHIFDRFYRVDKSRSRAVGGTGLGLSIVKWIVEVHHGEIAVKSTLGKGTTIEISLPIEALLIDNH